MTLASQITALATVIGTKFKTTTTDYNTKIGDLSTLTTSAKSSTTAAINEIKTGLSSAGAPINDSAPASTTTTYSGSKSESLAATKVPTARQINGKALSADVTLVWSDFAGLLPTAALPPLAINDTFTPATQTAMLALVAQRGDLAIRTDTGLTYVLTADDPTTLANWKTITAAGSVTAVAGKNGNVTLVVGDISGAQDAASVGDTTTDFASAFNTALV